MNKDTLHKLMERYLDAETSLDEERALREYLLKLKSPDDEETAVLAVMGYASLCPVDNDKEVKPEGKESSVNTTRKFFRKMLQYAASLGIIVMILTAVILSFVHKKSAVGSDAMCIAYVRGVEIKDEEEVMKLISIQLDEISQTSEEIRKDIVNDFEELSNALIEEGI